VEEGKIGINDPVDRYISAYAQTKVAIRSGSRLSVVSARRPITIRDLLTHTAGISYGVEPHIAQLYRGEGLGPAAGLGWYTADKDEPICETMERLASLPFLSQPGEAWVYGLNTDILGCVVERATGSTLAHVVRERITEPLGMRDTYFFVPPDQAHRLVTVYTSGSGRRATRAPEGALGQGHFVLGPRRNYSGGSGLVSTARDYARFLEMIRRGGSLDGVRILSPRSAMLMRTNQIGDLYYEDDKGFGFGFETTKPTGGADRQGDYGWGGAYGTIDRVDPDSGIVMLLMTQLMQGPVANEVRIRFQDLVYDAFGGRPQ
jgi:CubicO group peptidase (beta-lactamase class C family)